MWVWAYWCSGYKCLGLWLAITYAFMTGLWWFVFLQAILSEHEDLLHTNICHCTYWHNKVAFKYVIHTSCEVCAKISFAYLITKMTISPPCLYTYIAHLIKRDLGLFFLIQSLLCPVICFIEIKYHNWSIW